MSADGYCENCGFPISDADIDRIAVKSLSEAVKSLAGRAPADTEELTRVALQKIAAGESAHDSIEAVLKIAVAVSTAESALSAARLDRAVLHPIAELDLESNRSVFLWYQQDEKTWIMCGQSSGRHWRHNGPAFGSRATHWSLKPETVLDAARNTKRNSNG